MNDSTTHYAPKKDSLIERIIEWSARNKFTVFMMIGALFALRLMAKADPKLRHVYLRHRRYKPYYPARSTPFRENTPSQGKQYK